MEKLFLTLVLFWFSVCSFAEDYSFSVIKSGIGKKSVIFIPWLCEFGRRLEGGSGGIGNTLYLLRVDYGWFCRCTAGKKSILRGLEKRDCDIH